MTKVKKIDVGQRFGMLVYIKDAGCYTKDGHAMGIWMCDCGVEIERANGRIRRGHTKSCGCMRVLSRTTHGGSKTSEYTAWNAARMRCTNINDGNYLNYGGRGIKFCERWLNSFGNFYEDMGPKPTSNHSLDRYPDNDGDYEPGNCRWATMKQQSYNKRSTIKIKVFKLELTVPEVSKISGIRPLLLYRLIKKGRTSGIEEAMVKNGWKPSWGDLGPPKNLENYRWK